MANIEENVSKLVEFYEALDVNACGFEREMMMVHYDITNELYDFLLGKKKDTRPLYMVMLQKCILTKLSQGEEITKEFFNIMLPCLVSYISPNNNICDDPDSAEESDEDFGDNIDEEFENQQIIKGKFKWRDAQSLGLDKQKKQNYESGLFAYIMGSGKSNMILKTFDERKNNPIVGKHIYILTTYRTEIINGLFKMWNIELKIFKDILLGIFGNKNVYVIGNKLTEFTETENDTIKEIIKEAIKNGRRKGKFDRNIIGELCAIKKTELINRQQILHNAWKRNGIINMGDFVFVDAVNYKNRQQLFEKLDNDKKSILLIINNTFFEMLDFTEYIEKTNILIIDECHSVSADKFFKKVKLFKDGKCPVIGYSATPLRNTTKSSKNLMALFGKNDKLNVIASYDFFDAIKDDIIVPFKYHLIQCEKSEKNPTHKYNIFDVTYKEIEKTLPFSKTICWVNNSQELDKWYNHIKDKYGNRINLYVSSSFDKTFNKKYKNCNTSLEEFKEMNGNCMLLCINKCKEGFDDTKLDCGIQLSPVKNRAMHVTLQSLGRLLRSHEGKDHGTFIEFFLKDNTTKIEQLTVTKIIEYYACLLNLTSNEIEKDKLQKYRELYDNTVIDEKNNTIILRIDGNKKHDCRIIIKEKVIDWSAFRTILKENVHKKLEIDIEFEFKKMLLAVKDKFNINSDFWEEYKMLDHNKLGIPKDAFNYFKDIWEKKTWYDALGYTEFYELNELRNLILNRYNYKNNIDKNIYDKIRNKYNLLPPFPLEFYRLQNIQTYDELLHKL